MAAVKSSVPVGTDPSDASRISGKLIKVLKKMKQRNRRPARYPATIDQNMKQLDLLKIVSFFATMAGCEAAFYRFDLVSHQFLRESLLLVMLAMLLVVAAHTLQEALPEAVAVAFLTGVSMVFVLFHKLVSCAGPSWGLLFAVDLFCVAMILVWVYAIIKEDVRAPDEDDAGFTIPPV